MNFEVHFYLALLRVKTLRIIGKMTNFRDTQHLTLSSEKWKVDLVYESGYSAKKTIEAKEGDILIELSEHREWHSCLQISLEDGNSKHICIVTGIIGSTHLQKSSVDEKGHTVKIDYDNLVLSLGQHFISIDLNQLKLNWKLEPDLAEVFEFYDLDNDYLLRGELEIHRIDKAGNVKWSFSGADIWVNLEGRPEVEITENSIKLIDFKSDEYEIDFEGKELNTSYNKGGYQH
ncbi:hypothetical protein [Croceimicrobium hydrocarbonivorans]|uniref:Uncharacterized protein n=1 Tax=Croceimicrobium hydrocarbonivorans TaxID=2761580 RepID=A0A7H0VFN7_9FLAO|nr:hypothetical protein [Croceimicrobium hydrocarbonivorans]QNR24535.1 hypothetical protein H4K34_01460 [Croceimicrobium hydrocarbonivorans]